LYRSTDGGATWVNISSVQPLRGPLGFGWTVDGSTSPSTVYDGLGFRSEDFGLTWSAITPPPGADSSSPVLAADPGGTLYAADANGVFISRDQARSEERRVGKECR